MGESEGGSIQSVAKTDIVAAGEDIFIIYLGGNFIKYFVFH